MLCGVRASKKAPLPTLVASLQGNKIGAMLVDLPAPRGTAADAKTRARHPQVVARRINWSGTPPPTPPPPTPPLSPA